ncbi:hypothetical protein RUM43_007924 [Polyplax serrata]|uniref:Uncharacterized protein n=1 Tax=Polyplax serrata TaxID=468196 RepID=A0AAN8PN51_POLSC
MTSPLDMDPRNLGKRDDFPEVINKMRQQLLEQTERLTMSDPKETSSFIEKILQEDSQAGVAVVDLFVAVKRAKDKLNQLTEFNNEACQKMNVLKRDSTFMKINYQELVGSINDLYEKINDAAKQWVTGLPKAQDEKGAITQVSKSEDIKTEFISPDCSMSGDLLNSLITLQRSEGPLVDGKEQNRDKGDEEVASSQEKMKCSMCSKRSLIKQPSEKINQHTVHIINTVLEDMVAALVVNTLRQKLINNGSTGAEEESQNDKTYTTLDICQLLTNVGPEKVTEVTIESQRELCTEQMCSANCQVNGLLAGAGVCSKKLIDKGKEIGKNILGLRKSGRQLEESGENLSEEDSLFEEAMAEPVPDERTFTSANCMGDLTGNVNKKSVSTLTSNTGVETSWIGKITEEIKSKFWNLKPNFKRDFASPSNEEEEEEEKKLSPLEGVKFTINTGTPTGVFDVTVKQLKQYRSNSDNNDSKCCVSTAFQENSKLSSKMKDSEYYWSHESFEHSDSDGLSRMDSTSGGEGEDMEEFIEIYVHKNKGNSKDQEAIVTVEKGMSLETTIKQKILPLFEIEKCQPKYFVQEILPKHPQNEKIVMATSSKGNLQRGFGRSVKESDIVIYIQVEVDGEDIDDPKQIFIECNSSLDDLPINVESVTDQKSTEVNTRTLEEMRCPVTLLRCNRPREEETGSETIKIDEPEREIYSEMADDQTVFVKEPKKKSVTFLDENGETVQEQLIAEILPDDEEGEPEIGRNWDSQVSVKYLYNEMKANIRDMPRHYGHILRMDPKQNIQYVCYGFIETEAPELKTALDLIREIETNVVDVKLNDAIMILPNLEAELRKHLQCKMKVLSRDQSFGDSLQDFYSAVDFWPEDASDSESIFDSEERLYHLFALLSDLEGAVKGKVTSTADIGPCQQNSSRIYELLHALTQSIKDLETTTNMTNLAETVNIASQLDTAVREYDTIVKSADCKGVDNGNGKLKEKKSWVEVSVKEHMRNVRRNVFQTVEGEAIKTESRIDRDFDRIDRLERENEEAMNFVDAFLKKMIRRTEEVDDLKKELRDLSLTLEEYYRGAVKHKEVEKSKQGTMECHSQVEEEKKQEKEVVQMETLNEETVRNTISGLLSALNKLKARAKEKNEACKEILESVNQNSSIPAAKTAELDRNNSRSSRSSFTAKTTDDLFSILKEFRRIGDTSLYMAWSKPEGALSALVVGYEITVNGHVNQKVRNPQRTQAVLYSVDLSQKAEIQLFGIIENGTKILLSSVTHYDT